MYKHRFDQTILRSYDIRGVFKEKTLNVSSINMGFGIIAKSKSVKEKSI